MAANTGARPASGWLTVRSSASSRSGASPQDRQAAAIASSLRFGNTVSRIAASNTRAGSDSGVSLLTTTRLTTKSWVRATSAR